MPKGLQAYATIFGPCAKYLAFGKSYASIGVICDMDL